MAGKSLGKKSDTRLAKGLIKGLQGVDNKDANEMKALMNEVLKGGYKPVNKEMGGKVQKMKDGGKAVPVAKVKIERLKKMRDPYGESNFAHQISDGKDAYTQRVIAAMKESGQPFMYGGKVKKMRNGGSVNTTKSIQLNPKTGEPI
jgi:hypothetical protein